MWLARCKCSLRLCGSHGMCELQVGGHYPIMTNLVESKFLLSPLTWNWRGLAYCRFYGHLLKNQITGRDWTFFEQTTVMEQSEVREKTPSCQQKVRPKENKLLGTMNLTIMYTLIKSSVQPGPLMLMKNEWRILQWTTTMITYNKEVKMKLGGEWLQSIFCLSFLNVTEGKSLLATMKAQKRSLCKIVGNKSDLQEKNTNIKCRIIKTQWDQPKHIQNL